ncbi:DUF1593 domain-containing protein [Miniimonas arenae]|uniref:DUF1593 domain-containing protein n=1 Tax=Miniimonas arenae TaxID=676201 RepID=UPI0028A6DD35|nr:nucleoside hydrolase-like domain-containing protein [Miniimonas arenae]
MVAAALAALTLPMAVAGTAVAEPIPVADGEHVGTPRTIITTDPELDDLNSMLRTLLYSNDLDIVGLVYSASQHHYLGDPAAGVAPHRWPEISPDTVYHIDQAINAYEASYDNLVAHDADYPTPEHLRSLVAWGNVKNVGDMSEDTAGSDLIKSVLLDDEPGQVFLQAWGGPNTIARALKSIEDEYKGTPEWDAVYAKIVAKTVITSFGQQDTTFASYIKPNWPDIENREVATSIWGYGARGVVLPEHAQYLTPEWTKANVSDVGPIGAAYRVWGDGKQMAAGFDNEDYFGLSGYTSAQLQAMGYLVWTAPQPQGAWISEGDSSNFALLLDNGLRNWEDPTWGGWGGRQQQNGTDPVSWTNRGVRDVGPDGSPRNDYSAARWFEDFQLDFAARLQWAVTPDFADANHAPDVSVDQGIDLVRRAGETVDLSATSSDPDGDGVSTQWWQYREAGTYPDALTLTSDTENGTTSFQIPADATPGQTIHLIAEVKDDATPSLTSYQRVVITIAEAADPDGIALEATVPDTSTEPGTLTLSIASYGDAVRFSEARNLGDRLTFDAYLPEVTVTDTRNATQTAEGGWALTGRSSSFVANDAQFSADHLGWTPRVTPARDGLTAGTPTLGTLRGGPGLAQPATLASANDTGRAGIARASADLRLEIPVDTPDGDYSASLSVSLFPTD